MEKKKFPPLPKHRWVYFVNNWSSPIGVFSNVTLAAALFKHYYDKWGNPPEGALTVVRYRISTDYYKFKSEDITKSVLKIVCND